MDNGVKMVDITDKKSTLRQAVARAFIKMEPATLQLIKTNKISKGDVLTTAKIAGITGAKKVPEIIPLTHPITITHCQVEIEFIKTGLKIISRVKTRGPTGVEMEALAAVSLAALTVYDMCKPYDKRITISEICLLEKSGGKSGHWKRILTKRAF